MFLKQAAVLYFSCDDCIYMQSVTTDSATKTCFSLNYHNSHGDLNSWQGINFRAVKIPWEIKFLIRLKLWILKNYFLFPYTGSQLCKSEVIGCSINSQSQLESTVIVTLATFIFLADSFYIKIQSANNQGFDMLLIQLVWLSMTGKSTGASYFSVTLQLWFPVALVTVPWLPL